uniref:Uncharacterized protein n=1 Tax=Cannabis sativa TaxID=3483 RepID=A0A803QRB5_CANSA
MFDFEIRSAGLGLVHKCRVTVLRWSPRSRQNYLVYSRPVSESRSLDLDPCHLGLGLIQGLLQLESEVTECGFFGLGSGSILDYDSKSSLVHIRSTSCLVRFRSHEVVFGSTSWFGSKLGSLKCVFRVNFGFGARYLGPDPYLGSDGGVQTVLIKVLVWTQDHRSRSRSTFYPSLGLGQLPLVLYQDPSLGPVSPLKFGIGSEIWSKSQPSPGWVLDTEYCFCQSLWTDLGPYLSPSLSIFCAESRLGLDGSSSPSSALHFMIQVLKSELGSVLLNLLWFKTVKSTGSGPSVLVSGLVRSLQDLCPGFGSLSGILGSSSSLRSSLLSRFHLCLGSQSCGLGFSLLVWDPILVKFVFGFESLSLVRAQMGLKLAHLVHGQ